MPRRAHHEPAPPACCCYGCDGGGCAPAPCCCPAPVPAPCSYPGPVPTPCYYPAPVPTPCYYPPPAPAPVPVPPSSSASDHLLQAIAAHLLLGSSAPAPTPPPQSQPQPQPPPPAAPAANHAANPYPYPQHYQYQYQQQEAKHHASAHPPPAQHQPQPNASDHGHLVLHSLLRRVTALESALPRRSPHPAPVRRAPHPNPRPRRVARQQLVDDDDDNNNGDEDSDSSLPSPPRRSHRRPLQRPSARELAALTIQAHFRRFLARRSRTLRQLKELAVLRSKAAALRGALSGRRGGPDPAVVSEAAMGLLLQLDAIQGSDPMIREGRRAVSRELTRILEFVDKVLVKEHEQLSMGNALDNGECHEGCSAEFGPTRPAVNKKKVSFSSNSQSHVHVLNEDSGNMKEVDEGYESSGSSESEEVKGMPAKRSANGKPGLAPKPVHMESRRVAGEKR